MPADITIDGSGNLTGTIDIDEGTLIGTKEIEIIGDQGTRAIGFITDGTDVSIDERRAVESTVGDSFAPQAQTFFLDKDQYVGAVDLKVINLGPSGDIIAQIRKTDAGIPTQEVLAETRIEFASLVEDWNRFAFAPVFLLGQTEYCIVIYTDSTEHTLGIGELGKIDTSGDAVTKQSYQQGVRLSSSNGINWTAHQTQDLMFRIMACEFTQTSIEIDLGDTESLTDITDLAILAGYELPNRDTNIQFKITDPDSIEYVLDRDQVLTFSSAKTGIFNLKAILTGTSEFSPILFKDTQLLAGAVGTSEDYISKIISAPATFNVTVKVETKLNGPSPNFQLFIVEDDGGGGTQETELTVEPNTQSTVDGWEYRIYKGTSLTAFTTGIRGYRIKIVETGDIGSRPYARNLVSVVSE
jgi:hypothetical protein